jgi:hypothetical protein
MLVRSDARERADVIVVAADADGAGVLEAADLVHEGFATKVALFVNPRDKTTQELQRRGVPYTDEATRGVYVLRTLGVQSVEMIAPAVGGTGDEARILPGWCDRMGYRAVLFVSTADHSRRTHRELIRAARGSSIRIMVRYSRYSGFEPDRWWQTRGGVRTELVESEKLLLDFLLHPFS